MKTDGKMKIHPDRPYVICHMLASSNNKISGGFMASDETAALVAEYVRIDKEFKAAAWLCGKTTMEEFIRNLNPKPFFETPDVSREDFIARANAKEYVVVIDPAGELRYEKAFLERGGRRSHILAVLSRAVKNGYPAYLQKLGISYIFAGEKETDLPLAMQKLKFLFGVDVLVSHGGSYTNGRLLDAGLIDELSLIRVPVREENEKEVSVFGTSCTGRSVFTLQCRECLNGGGEHLSYLVNGRTS